MPPGGIRTRSPSRLAVADPSLNWDLPRAVKNLNVLFKTRVYYY
jgi:hypothetical protein